MKNVDNSLTLWNILIKFCIRIDIDDINPRDGEMTFIIGRGFAERQILKKMKIALSLELSGIFSFGLISVYGPSTHFRSFRARSVYLATLFLGKPPRQFTSTWCTFFRQ